jgi:lysophospholipase L1-like esterase
VRRKLVLVLGALVLVAVVGGTAGVAAGHTVASSPAQPGKPGQLSQQRGQQRRQPLLAVAGASFAAGVGAGHPGDAWPEDLARMLGWRVAVSADPGAGYVNPGAGHRGPFSRLAARLDLARLDPGVVIIQGGHDDIGRPLPLVRERVENLVATIHRAAPRARLAVLTVFTRGNRRSQAARATDQTIVAAARHADPAVLVFDPLAGRWHFPRAGDHLHPTAAGHRWIARRLAAGLRERVPAA